MSAHFKKSEFKCHCGAEHEYYINPDLMAALEQLRLMLGNAPIKISSGFRCKFWNKRVGGSKSSQHLYGYAADITVKGYKPIEVAQAAENIHLFNNGGIGVYDSFTHVDVRGSKARWGAGKYHKVKWWE